MRNSVFFKIAVTDNRYLYMGVASIYSITYWVIAYYLSNSLSANEGGFYTFV